MEELEEIDENMNSNIMLKSKNTKQLIYAKLSASEKSSRMTKSRATFKTRMDFFKNKQEKITLFLVWMYKWRALDILSALNILVIQICYFIGSSENDGNSLEVQMFILNLVFFVEFGLKVFINYKLNRLSKLFTDAWNIMSIVSTIYSFVAYCAGSSIKLYSLKVLLFLKFIKNLPIRQIKRLSKAILKTTSVLPNVIFFTLFFILIFSICGNQIFSNKIYNRCRIDPYKCEDKWCTLPVESLAILCNVNTNNCPDQRICINFFELANEYPEFRLNDFRTDDYDIEQRREFRYGLTSFDNIIYSFLNVLALVTFQNFNESFDLYTNTEVPVYLIVFFQYFVSFFGGLLVFKLILASQNECLVNTQMENEMVKKEELRVTKMMERYFIKKTQIHYSKQKVVCVKCTKDTDCTKFEQL